MDKICFVDHAFLSATLLSPDNVIEYFSRSPFYDASSVNEIVKMQNQYRGISVTEDVSKYNGIYYVLEHSNTDNTLFIIRQSINKDNVHTNKAFYYVIYGHIYQAPSQESVYKSGINNIFWHLCNTLDYYVDNELLNKNTEETKKNEDDRNLPEEVLIEILDEFKKYNC
ncbi:hypothetical protein P3W45_000897 [Vairimorpha bombi]|jgi:mediator of RNA polymerase II transcription subunit 6